MTMTPEKIHAQREMDEEIVFFVRGMQSSAAVRSSSIHSYLRHSRRRLTVTELDVELRLDYLCDKQYLKCTTEWVAGEGDIKFYEVTANGSDALDGVIPWN